MAQLARKLAPLLLGLAAAHPAYAHEYWLSPSVWRVGPSGTVAFGGLAGVGFVGERKLYAPERTVRLVARAARELDLMPVASPGDSTWARFATADEGGLLLAYESSFATITLDAAAFDRYLAEAGLDGPLAARRALPDPGPGHERYRRCAKAWLEGSDAGRSMRPLGLPLEIVPLAAPGADAALPVRVVFEGRPLPGAVLHAWRQPLGPGMRPLDPARRDSVGAVFRGRTDAGGEIRVPVGAEGEWLLSVVHMIPSRDPLAADWESTWASLVFARGRARP